MTYVCTLNASHDEIVTALSQNQQVKPITEIPDSNVAAYIMDCKGETQLPHLNTHFNRPVILINAENLEMMEDSPLCIPSRAMIYHQKQNYSILEVLDTPVESTAGELYKCNVLRENEQKNTILYSKEDAKQKNNSSIWNAEQLAGLIEEAIDPEHCSKLFQEIEEKQDLPVNLPVDQYNIQYVKIATTISAIDGSSQNAVNEMLMCVSLIASFNPNCKYLQISTYGAGFNPGDLAADGKYDRRYFHHDITTQIHCLDSALTTYATEPKNINGVTSYTESTSFNVGVDISKNPGFQAGYTISHSSTTNVQDFMVINNSSGRSADWEFRLGMTYNSMWDMFKEPTLRKGQVKSLPVLAKTNAQPYSDAIFMANGDYNGVVSLQLAWHAQYCHAWVTGDWVEFTKWYHLYSYGFGYWEGNNPWKINFNCVHA